MAHNLKPNTNYAIVTVKLAIPTEAQECARCPLDELVNEGEISDAINELIRPGLLDDDSLIADYAFDYEIFVTRTDGDPEEGDVF